MASKKLARAKVFTIAGERCFVDSLAAGLMARYGKDPHQLAEILILLPTRRAARALREAFLRITGGAPLLLPRMMPLGDVDEEELTLSGGELGGSGGAEIVPAIGETKRLAILAKLVGGWIETERRRGGDFAWADATPSQALQLAGELARLLDQMQTDQVPLENLQDLVTGDLARHWQATLDFLALLGTHWPRILAGEGALDPAARRNLLLQRQAALWQAHPPEFPVIAAGSTGSIPATRALLQVVARLPQGAVVLPGLDRVLGEEAWAELGQTHPQFGLRELLQAMEVERASVLDWQEGEKAAPNARSRLLSIALAPHGSHWGDALGEDDALAGVERADCATPQHEAVAIALALRGALEQAGRSAALITPDRNLARRVAAELQRWGIDIDDSGGIALAQTPPLTFAALALDAIAAQFAPVALLALLKHPFAALGLKREDALRIARALDRDVLRGPQPAPGLDGLRALLPGRLDHNDAADITDLIGRLERACAPLLALQRKAKSSCADFLAATLATIEALAGTDRQAGAAILWRLEAGEASAALLDELARAASDLGALTPQDWPALFAELTAAKMLRPRFGKHPRLAILGPLEARLQRFDLIVLGGMNEGTWPPEVDTGPWLSRPMREKLGLPLPERRIGLAAHDFVQAFAAQQVLLTRAERVEGTPTVPSRFLVKIDALLKFDPDRPETLPAYRQRGARWAHWAAALDRPDKIEPRDHPAPRPKLAHRPRSLSVTDVELWRRDPYALYAKRILKLSPLDALQEEPGLAERGTLVHRVLQQFLTAFSGAMPHDGEQRLLDLGREYFAALLLRPGEKAFWWPRFENLARWFVAAERMRRAGGTATLACEAKGEWSIEAPGGAFKLRATADRIDRGGDGVEIIDYKTGRIPNKDEIEAGFAPQLPLEGAIAEAGMFALPGPRAKLTVAGLAHWQVNGQGEGGKIAPIADPAQRIAEARAGLIKLIARFDLAATAYLPQPQPRYASRFNDYEHLERIDEWTGKAPDGKAK